MEKSVANEVDAHALVYKAGGISSITIAALYVIMGLLYVFGSTWPEGGENWLRYLSVHATEWWTFLVLSVISDVFILTAAWALWVALRKTSKDGMMLGCMLLLLYVALDLSVTWPSFYSLLNLSARYTTSVSETETRLIVANANAAYDLLTSGWIQLYNILAPSLGILAIGMVMLRGHFGKTVGYLGVSTGVVGTAAVVGPYVISDLSILVIVVSVLLMMWSFFVGLELLALSRKVGGLTPEKLPADSD